MPINISRASSVGLSCYLNHMSVVAANLNVNFKASVPLGSDCEVDTGDATKVNFPSSMENGGWAGGLTVAITLSLTAVSCVAPSGDCRGGERGRAKSFHQSGATACW